MDKEAVGMERDWHAMMAAFDLCPHDMSTPDRMRWIAAEFRRRADGAQQPAAQAAGLTDEGIIDIAELDGVATYETGWYRMTRAGLLAFARALLSRAAPSGEPVAFRVLRKRHDGEWTTDGRGWCDGSPSADMKEDIAARADNWRIEYAYAAPQPSAQQAEQPAEEALGPFNTADEAIAALRVEEARGVDGGLMEAIRRYAFLFALHTQNNTDASRADADAALARIRSLLAAPAAGTGHEKPVYCICSRPDPEGGYCQNCGEREWPQAATGAKGNRDE